MKKRILLIGYNYYPEPTGIGKYNGEMIAWLAQKGYDCEVVTSYPYYPQWEIQKNYSSRKRWFYTEYFEAEGVRIKVNRCPIYVPAAPTGIKRSLLDLSFLVSAFMKIVQLIFEKKFDYVITVVPGFHLGLLAVLYKKIRKAVLLYHIQDLQIEAARDLKLINSKFIIRSLFRIEKYILRQSDVISSISEGMVEKISRKASKTVYLFSNWTDCNLFYPIEDKSNLKEKFGFNSSDKIILYSGAIGEKQGLEAILYAAKALESQQNIKFIICGSGPYKQKLSLLAAALGLKNLSFFPLQPLDKFNFFLNLADVHLVIQKSDASDLVMPSKLATVLGVGGLALVTARIGSSLYKCISQHHIGLLIEPENQQALNEAIRKATFEDYAVIKKNARAYATAHLSIDKVMEAFSCSVLQKLPVPAIHKKTQQELVLAVGKLETTMEH